MVDRVAAGIAAGASQKSDGVAAPAACQQGWDAVMEQFRETCNNLKQHQYKSAAPVEMIVYAGRQRPAWVYTVRSLKIYLLIIDEDGQPYQAKLLMQDATGQLKELVHWRMLPYPELLWGIRGFLAIAGAEPKLPVWSDQR